MPRRFFVDSSVEMGRLAVEGPVAEHMARSLRMRAGDTAVVVDRDDREHGIRLVECGPARVVAEVVWSRAATGEPGLRLTVLQALPRDRMEDCIDALVEVGVAEIRPVITEHVVSRPDADRVERRVARWRAVAAEAAQLAGRGTVPGVHPPEQLQAALAALPDNCRVIACSFDGSSPLDSLSVDAGLPLALCIGPEGGLGAADTAILAEHGAETVHLGARVLRTRYAGMVAAALLLSRAGDLAAPLATDPW